MTEPNPPTSHDPPETIPELAALTAPQSGASPPIPYDLPCVRCDYNLRGLTFAGACPECGAAISLSRHGLWLSYAEPHWVRKLAWGMWTVSVSQSLAILLCLLGAMSLLELSHDPGEEVLIVAMQTLCAATTLAGAWLATTDDPNRAAAEPPFPARLWARCGCAASTLGFILAVAFVSSGAVPPLSRAKLFCWLGLASTTLNGSFILLSLETLQRRLPGARMLGTGRFLAAASAGGFAGLLLRLIPAIPPWLLFPFNVAGPILILAALFPLYSAAAALSRAAAYARVAARYPEAHFLP